MTDDLVKRMRGMSNSMTGDYDGEFDYWAKTADHAADRIEAQAAEIERLQAEVKNAWCDGTLPCRQLLDAKQEIERLRAVVMVFQGFGCPVCSGDCGSANPPVMCCPMQQAHAALGDTP